MSGALNQQLLRLAGVLQLQDRARSAPRNELGFVIVNETMQAVAYDQAALWDARRGRVVALSGAAEPEQGSPYVQHLRRIFRRARLSGPVESLDLPAQGEAFLAPHALLCGLIERGRTVAILLLARQDPWTTGEQELLSVLCGAYAQSWELARARRAPMSPGGWRWLRRGAAVAIVAGIVALGFVPVRSTAIAPAEVAAANPAFVRAPFAGVVDSIAVGPNEAVKLGQVLVKLDRRQLEAQLRVAVKSLDVAEAQYRQAAQEAIIDPRAREQLAVLRSRLDEARADVDYRRTLLERADIPAPAPGVAVFNDPAEWIGKPVETGERIMLVAPPVSSRIEIELPAAEAVTLELGARVVFFDNINPDAPVEGRLIFMSYGTSTGPSGILAYTGRADLVDGTALRLGQKGTAKIYGPERPLVLWVLRRPIAWLRELLA